MGDVLNAVEVGRILDHFLKDFSFCAVTMAVGNFSLLCSPLQPG